MGNCKVCGRDVIYSYPYLRLDGFFTVVLWAVRQKNKQSFQGQICNYKRVKILSRPPKELKLCKHKVTFAAVFRHLPRSFVITIIISDLLPGTRGKFYFRAKLAGYHF